MMRVPETTCFRKRKSSRTPALKASWQMVLHNIKPYRRTWRKRNFSAKLVGSMAATIWWMIFYETTNLPASSFKYLATSVVNELISWLIKY